MPQLDFFLFRENIIVSAVIFVGFYLYIFSVFFPKAIFYLKMKNKLIGVLKTRITIMERYSDLTYCVERKKFFLKVSTGSIELKLYNDL